MKRNPIIMHIKSVIKKMTDNGRLRCPDISLDSKMFYGLKNELGHPHPGEDNFYFEGALIKLIKLPREDYDDKYRPF